MKNTLICNIVALAVAGSVSLCATSALANPGSDGFNRSKIGANWVSTAGVLRISKDQLSGKTLSLGYFTPGAANTAASVTVFLGGTDLEYGAVALGDIGVGSDAFVKLQSQNGLGTFDSAGFYTGNNAGDEFFDLTSAVPSPAILDVYFCGTVATMRITSADGVQTYTFDYGATYGAGIGLGTYGSVRMDNFIGFASSCKDGPAEAVNASDLPKAKDLSLKE